MGFVFFAVLLFGIALWVGVVRERNAKKRKTRVILQYGADEIYASTIDRSFIAIDFAKQRIVLGNGPSESTYEFSQVISAEIVANESTLTKTNRGSQLLGTAVGGAFLGGFGALLGGLSGSTRSQTRLKRLSLKVIVDDLRQPVYNIIFFKDSGKGADPDGMLARPAVSAIQRMHAQLTIAMKKAQEGVEAATLKVVESPLPTGEKLAQLDKLWELKLKGVLSEEEFDTQKQLLLSKLGDGRADYDISTFGCNC